MGGFLIAGDMEMADVLFFYSPIAVRYIYKMKRRQVEFSTPIHYNRTRKKQKDNPKYEITIHIPGL